MANKQSVAGLIYKYTICKFLGNKRRCLSKGSSSNSSRISTREIQLVIDRLRGQSNRKSTTKNYLSIWRQFNRFVIKLDVKPRTWEDRVVLFIGYKIDQGIQSSTIRCYVSAIKRLLIDDGYPWDDQKAILSSMIKACKLVNDRVHTRLPIQCGLLELILFDLERKFSQQPYLLIMYQTLFALSYYGLLRISEVTVSDPVLKAKHLRLATNKDKIMIVLYSSKTHTTAMRPQKIKITANDIERADFYRNRHFCPFELVQRYKYFRGGFDDAIEQFFIFRDRSPVSPDHARTILKQVLESLGLDSSLYGFHSFRVGRTTDLIKSGQYTLEEVKRMGHWRSNIIYNYIRSW